MKVPLRQISGKNGRLLLWPNRVSIERSGSLARFTTGLRDQELLLPAISQVSLRRSPLPGLRLILFSVRSRDGSGGPDNSLGKPKAAVTESSVLYEAAQQLEFEAFKAAVEAERASACGGSTQSSLVPGNPRSGSGKAGLDQMQHQASMRDHGHISEAEFRARSKALFGF